LVVHYAPVVGRGELTDKAWAVIEPLLPEPGRRSGRWRDHRQVINGILWKLRTGAPWRDLPERYGPWKTCHERLRRWTADGTWDRILAQAQVFDDGQPVEWIVSVDPRSSGRTSIRLAPAKGGAARDAVAAADGEALGRSRGGLRTKIHLAVDRRGRPLSILLTGGHAGDNPQLLSLLDAIAVNRPGRAGRGSDPTCSSPIRATPTTRPGKGYATAGSATPSPNAATRWPARTTSSASLTVPSIW
jgi:transposase